LLSENISKFVQTKYATLAHLTEGGILKNGPARNEEKSREYRVGTRKMWFS